MKKLLCVLLVLFGSTCMAQDYGTIPDGVPIRKFYKTVRVRYDVYKVQTYFDFCGRLREREVYWYSYYKTECVEEIRRYPILSE